MNRPLQREVLIMSMLKAAVIILTETEKKDLSTKNHGEWGEKSGKAIS